MLSTTTSAGHGKTTQVWADLKAMKVKERQILKNYEKSEMKQNKSKRSKEPSTFLGQKSCSLK